MIKTGTLTKGGGTHHLVVPLVPPREHFGETEVSIEEGKKENRSDPGYMLTMNQFLDVSHILLHACQKRRQSGVIFSWFWFLRMYNYQFLLKS